MGSEPVRAPTPTTTTTTTKRDVTSRDVSDVVVVVERARKFLPGEWEPHPLIRRYRTDDDVIIALQAEPIRMPLPDATDLVNDNGAEACVGAIMRVISQPLETWKRPRGILVYFVVKKKGWKPDQVEQYVKSELDNALARLEATATTNPTVKRFFEQIERERVGSTDAPENVIQIRESAG